MFSMNFVASFDVMLATAQTSIHSVKLSTATKDMLVATRGGSEGSY
jgi:hypothetical protein